MNDLFAITVAPKKSFWYARENGSKIGKYKVFGCPVVAKVYARSTAQTKRSKKTNLNSKNIIQRGVRGIFVGFPKEKPGWQIFVPQSGRVMTTVDVAFDEDFSSQGLAYDKTLYHNALSVRGDTALYVDETRTFAQTGPPQGLEFFL